MLFSFTKKDQLPLDIYFYDGLANQTEDIRLSINEGNSYKEQRDLVPPIELCLQTKWKTIRVDWNGTDPLL